MATSSTSTSSSRDIGSARTKSSSSSMSDDYDDSLSSDDDSIGPLPPLQRNKSLIVRRPLDESEQRLRKKTIALLTNGSNSPRYKPPTRHRSIDFPPESPPGSHYLARCHDGPILPVPRRVRSLQPQGDLHQMTKLSEPNAYMQTKHNSKTERSNRPDPPEQIRPLYQNVEKRRNVVPLSDTAEKEVELSQDPLYRGKMQPRRTASMPLFVQTSDNRDRSTRPDDDNIDGMFSARRCKSIARSFVKKSGVDHDVWVERMVVRKGKDPHVFFKSVFSREIKSEPPTGAVNVIYMDDLVKVQHLRSKNRQSSQSTKEEMTTLAPLVKKRSLWGRPKPKKKSSSEPPSVPSRTWKSSIGLGNRRKK